MLIRHPRCGISAAASSGTRPAAAAAAPARAPALAFARRRQRAVPAAAAQTQLVEAVPLTAEAELEAAAAAIMSEQPPPPSSPQQAADAADAPATPPAQAATRGGALSLVGPGGREAPVPSTLPSALATFFTHPSALLIVAALAGLAAWRGAYPVDPAADGAVAAGVAAFWLVQEWLLHALLLHSSWDWLGRRIHVGHHHRPYFHVSIDDPPIVLAFMAASLGLAWAGLGVGAGQPGLALTAALAYYGMGLLYEWTHYIVHTRYVPRSKAGRAIRQHHMLHHTRSEAAWLAFTVPQVDALFGTLPADPAAVRMTPMAKAGLAAARQAASGTSTTSSSSVGASSAAR